MAKTNWLIEDYKSKKKKGSEYTESEGKAGGSTSASSSFGSSGRSGNNTGNSLIDEYLDQKQRRSAAAATRMDQIARQYEKQREERERWERELQQRKDLTDFMRAEREGMEAGRISDSRHPSAYEELLREGTWQQEQVQQRERQNQIEKSSAEYLPGSQKWNQAKTTEREALYNEILDQFAADPQAGEISELGETLYHGLSGEIDVEDETQNLFFTTPTDYLTPEERQVYNYALAKRGKRDASEYLRQINPQLNQRATQGWSEYGEKIGREMPVRAAILDALVSSFVSPVGVLYAFGQDFQGKEADLNSPYMAGVHIDEALRSGIKENKLPIVSQGVSDFLIDTGLSMAQSAARMPLGAAGLALAGGGAASGAYVDARERGAKSGQALTQGLAQGIAEAAFENISLEQLQAFKTAPAKNVKDFFKNVLKQSITEGTEEMSTEAVNSITDWMIMGDMAQGADEYQAYISQGMDPGAAKKQVAKNYAQRILLAGAGGALSGGVMGAGAQAVGLAGQELDYRAIGNEVNPDYRDYAREIQVDPEHYLSESDYAEAQELQDLALEYANRQQAGETISARERGQYEIRWAQLERRAQEARMASEQAREQDTAEAGATPEKMQEGVSGQEAMEDIYDQVMENQREQEDTAEMARTGTESRESWPGEEIMTGAENGQETPSGASGFEDYIAEERFQGSDDEFGTEYGRNGKIAYADQYDGSVPVDQYSQAFGRMYDSGRYNVDTSVAERSVLLSVLTPEQMDAAYKAGGQDRLLDLEGYKNQVQQIRGMGVAHAGGLTESTETATPAQKTIAEHVGKLTGLHIELVEGGESGEAASYNREKGRVCLSVNSADFMGSLSHEITHFIRDYSPELYGSYRDSVVGSLMKSQNVSYEKLVDTYAENYAAAGKNLSREDVIEEIVADATQNFLNDEETVREIIWKNKTIGEKMIQFLSDIIDAIKDMIHTATTRKAARALEENLQTLEYARTIWLAGMEEAGEYYRGERQAGTQEQNAGEERFRLANPEAVTAKQIEENFQEVRDMEPVRILTGNEFGKGEKDLITQVTEFYASLGGVVHHEDVGDILLNRKSVKDDIAHGIGRKKAISFAAVPDVLEKGKVLDFQKNWKGRKKDTAVIGAPVRITDGPYAGDYYELAVVTVGEDNRMYLHEVYTIKTGSDTPFKTSSVPQSGSRSGDNPSPILSIFQKLAGVNEDKTKFQLKEPAEETKDLIAIHNLTADKLQKLLQYEGIPMPSIAITKAALGHENFGDVSLLFRKETIDPKNRKNKVYSADVWSPTFPRIEYDVNENIERNFYKLIRQNGDAVPKSFQDDAKRITGSIEESIKNYGDVEDILKRLSENYGMKAQYLAQNDQTIEPIYKEVRTEMPQNDVEFAKRAIAEFGEEQIQAMRNMNLSILYGEYGQRLLDLAEETGGRHIDAANWEHSRLIQKAINRRMDLIEEYQNTGGVTVSQVEDLDAERARIDELIDQKQYEAWLEQALEGAILDSGITNGKDPYTPSGNSRSFKQLHYPVTAQNIVRSMLTQGTDAKNIAGFMGVKSLRSKLADEFKSIRQIKDASGKLKSIETKDYQAKLGPIEDRLDRVMQEITSEKDGYNAYAMSTLGECLLEAMNNPTASNIRQVLEGYRWTVTEAQAEELSEIAQEIHDMPVDMFEAKPQRVVGYDEVAAAVLPDNVDDQVVDALTEKGIRTILYEADNEAARKAAVNSVDDVKFQLEDVDYYEESYVNQILRENAELKEANQALRHQFELTSKEEMRQSDIHKVSAAIAKKYSSKIDLKTLDRNLTRIYEYIRSGDEVAWNEVSEAATAVGRSILNQSIAKDTTLTDQYKDLRKQIRETKITLGDEDKTSLVDGYANFRKKNFGKLRLGEGGIQVDVLYQELAEQYPELFDKSIINAAEQLEQIAMVMDMTAPKVQNPYHAEMDELSYMVGQELLAEYQNVRQPRPTYADRKELEIQKAKDAYNLRMSAFQKRLAKQYTTDIESTKRRYEQRLQRQRDSQRRRDARRQVMKEVSRMKKALLEPTEKKHIPEQLRGTVARFLGSIDFSSSKYPDSQRTLDWIEARNAFAAIANKGGVWEAEDESASMYMDIDPDLVAKIDSALEQVKQGKRLDELDAYHMEELLTIVRSMKEALYKIDETRSNQQFEKISDLVIAVSTETANKKDKRDLRGVAGDIDKMLNVNMLDPQTMFGKMGKAMYSTYRALRGGLDKKTILLRDAQAYFEQALKDTGVSQKDVRKWMGSRSETKTFHLPGGDLELTIPQIMSLYELNKRDQAKLHMYDRKGGIKADAIVKGWRKDKNGKWQMPEVIRKRRPVRLSEADVNTITETLTAEQKRLADALQKYMGDQVADWGNEVTMRMYGYKKFTAKNYFPIVTDKNYVATKQGNNDNGQTIKNMGITKSTNKYANNPIIIEDIFKVWTRQVDQMSTYNAYVEPLSDLQKLLNFKSENGSIKERLEGVFGKDGLDYINKLISDLNGTVADDPAKGTLSRFMSNMRGTAVAGNLRVAIQQPTAIARAAAEIDMKYLAKAMAKPGNWDTILEYAPIAQWKDWGYYRMQTSRQMKDVLVGADSLQQRILNNSMILAELGDKIAWQRLWGAVELETQEKHKNLKVGSEEYNRAVGERFSEIVDKTQVADSVLHRTQFMRSQDGLVKEAMAFMAEPMKSYNMLYRGFMESTKENRKPFLRAGAAYIASSFLTAAAASVVDALRDSDRKKKWTEKYVENIKENMFSSFLVLNNIPYIKDVISIAQGFSPTRSELKGFQDFSFAMKKVYNLIKRQGKYTPQYVFMEAARSVSVFAGVPIESVARDAYAIIDTVFNAMGSEDDYQWLKQTYDIRLKDNWTMYAQMMLQAGRSGDTRLKERIHDDLLAVDLSEDEINNRINLAINKEFKEMGGDLAAAAAEGQAEFQTQVDLYVTLKEEAGWDEKKCLSTIKSTLTTAYKTEYLEGDQKQKEEISRMLTGLKYNGMNIYSLSEIRKWKE